MTASSARAQLELYRASSGEPPAKAPDVVIRLPGNSDAAALYSTTDTLNQTLTLPTSIETVYLDVIAQSQSSDEFWYCCVPDDLTGRCRAAAAPISARPR